MSPRRTTAFILTLLLAALPCAASGGRGPDPVPLPGLEYVPGLFPGTDYDPAVPTPGKILGFPLGSRVASPEEIGRCLHAWEAASPRMKVFEYARSYEGRPLYYVALTTPENQGRLDSIRQEWARLGDPEDLSAEEGSRLAGSLPAAAWVAHSIHGDETSGADAALGLIYHLAAARGAGVERLLDELVVLVDPMMNPDGRARWHQQLTEHRGAMPNVDDQSLLHSGYWPWGRMNHYLFDLNRDWTLGVNPETRGRIRAAGSWNPLLMVDAHEMGAQDTYLFSPARPPRQPHFPGYLDRWSATFASEQAAAFDRAGWTYYTGEWNEGWYPGYTDNWGAFRGAVGVLYEQAGVAEDAVRRPHGALLPYMESVHHQLTSALANLESLRAHAGEIKQAFLDDRREAVSASGPFADRIFAVLPTANRGRLNRFLDLMHLQGIRVYRTEQPFTAGKAVDQLGRSRDRVEVPAGTVLVPNRQPLAHLVAAMLEFDTQMTPEYLARERREILKRGRSSIYDLTAWNITMLQGLEALTLQGALPAGARRLQPEEPAAPGGLEGPAEPNLWAVDGADDRSVSLAGRLMEAGVEVRVADAAFELEGHAFARGSVVVLASDNTRLGMAAGELRSRVKEAAEDAGLTAVGIVAGLGKGDLPDIGGRHFRLLEPPRIALLARGGVSAYDFGTTWHLLDQSLGLRHSHLDEENARRADLRRYNVIVVPDRWFGSMDESLLSSLESWVQAGGTLIAVGRSAGAVAGKESKLSAVRSLPDVLDKLDDYEMALRREWLAASGAVPPGDAVWSHVARPMGAEGWAAGLPASRPPVDDLKARDQWQRPFMPRGTVLAARTDQEHWLTFGTGPDLPVLTATYPVLMAGEGVEAAVRYGVLEEAKEAPRAGDGKAEPARVGWAEVPPGREMRLRMSGLLWPEAAERMANSAYLTREGKGNGQVILFSAPPNFRGATLGTARLMANALVYGPGLGADHPIEP